MILEKNQNSLASFHIYILDHEKHFWTKIESLVKQCVLPICVIILGKAFSCVNGAEVIMNN